MEQPTERGVTGSGAVPPHMIQEIDMAEVEVTADNEMSECTFHHHDSYVLEATSELRFVVRYENIDGFDNAGNAAAVGQRKVQVLQQRWWRRNSIKAETFWQDVPTVED